MPPLSSPQVLNSAEAQSSPAAGVASYGGLPDDLPLSVLAFICVFMRIFIPYWVKVEVSLSSIERG